ncbi:hypothetical protein [Enterovirga rhinocerotis]|uniref:Uncharacterized protein n=1 Tax=Enterovirga rhinocerotis TaxID=1339210 RepID=A0A4R7C718_9HYPH|nr:hypothetical protein [Enterovirga rhinocerotis]TDR94188.1 hypothetical protein EV668_1466 [Enterovirga rhinocerotis]
MSPAAASEIEAIAASLARMPLADRRRPDLPHEIRSDLVQRLRQVLRSEGKRPALPPLPGRRFPTR